MPLLPESVPVDAGGLHFLSDDNFGNLSMPEREGDECLIRSSVVEVASTRAAQLESRLSERPLYSSALERSRQRLIPTLILY
jgi:hypothetical protein